MPLYGALADLVRRHRGDPTGAGVVCELGGYAAAGAGAGTAARSSYCAGSKRLVRRR